jgi:hypothetical protein
MSKKIYLVIVKLLLLFGLSTVVLAEDSCTDYSGDAKNICNSVVVTKADFYKKYSMDTTNPAQNQLTSSCDDLSGIEKDTCTTKNSFIDQHVLSSSTPTSAAVAATKSQAIQENQSNEGVTEQTEQTEQLQTAKNNSKVNIFNN